MYEFKDYAQKINSKQGDVSKDFGYISEPDAKSIAINFDKEKDLDAQMTVVCGGAARGGSSILPYLLNGLGLQMGTFEADNYEDIEMLRNRRDTAKLLNVIEKRNGENERWGFKIPSLRRGQYGFFDDKLRNPVFVFIVRNPLLTSTSVLSRANSENFTQDRKGFSNAIIGCLQTYLEFVIFMKQTESPCLMIPMENLSKKPLETVKFISEHLRLSQDDAVLEELAKQVSVPGYKPRADK